MIGNDGFYEKTGVTGEHISDYTIKQIEEIYYQRLHRGMIGKIILKINIIMKQNINWMNFFHIGISAIFLLFTNSCDGEEIDYILTTNFVYKNSTSVPVELKLYDNTNTNFKNYSIAVDSEITISLKQEGSKTGIGQPFATNEGVATKVTILFTSHNKCLDNSKILSVKDYDNFSESMYNTSNNTFIYNIDNTELINAVNCF